MSGNVMEDVVENLKEMGSGMPGDPDKPFKMPTREELLEMLDSMGLGDEEKEELRAALLSDDPVVSPKSQWTAQAIILFFFLAFLLSIIGLIGYRLYNSMNAREMKREEKKQKKIMKKKK